MKQLTRRNYKRKGTLALANIRILHQGDYFKGRILNFSSKGMYIESDTHLKKGDYLEIVVDTFYSDPSMLENKDNFHGEVVWVQVLNDPYSAMYGYGIQLAGLQ